ncbi:MAG: dihydropteroate synthase [Agathobacter sp.]
MRIGNKNFDTKEHTYVMGILNVTPDSFSDGGKYSSLDAARKHAEEMMKEGATILDIGGESTRPGYTKISDAEEIARILPVIEAVKKDLEIPISVDTYKPSVAKAAIEAGADLVNDIWGLKSDPYMARLIAEKKVACCLMHNRDNKDYNNFVSDLIKDLRESVDLALKAGIRDDKIILDPGIGFAKTLEQNLQALKHLDRLQQLGYPVLLGTSRKSVIGDSLNLPKDERLEGTLATTALAVKSGCKFVRVHDVKENVRVVRMMEAILKA